MAIMVRVVVINCETEEVIHDRVGDHNNGSFRIWMGKTAFWALRNNRKVGVVPINTRSNQS